jgi:hypothetical protein
MSKAPKPVPVTAGHLNSAQFALTSDPKTLLLRLTDSNGATFDCAVDGPRIGMLFAALSVRLSQLPPEAMDSCDINVDLGACTHATFGLQLDPTQQVCSVRVGIGPARLAFHVPRDPFFSAAVDLMEQDRSFPSGSAH